MLARALEEVGAGQGWTKNTQRARVCVKTPTDGAEEIVSEGSGHGGGARLNFGPWAWPVKGGKNTERDEDDTRPLAYVYGMTKDTRERPRLARAVCLFISSWCRGAQFGAIQINIGNKEQMANFRLHIDSGNVGMSLTRVGIFSGQGKDVPHCTSTPPPIREDGDIFAETRRHVSVLRGDTITPGTTRPHVFYGKKISLRPNKVLTIKKTTKEDISQGLFLFDPATKSANKTARCINKDDVGRNLERWKDQLLPRNTQKRGDSAEILGEVFDTGKMFAKFPGHVPHTPMNEEECARFFPGRAADEDALRVPGVREQ